MPRVARKVPGRRTYGNYSRETLRTAINEIISGRMSYRQASERYGIPVGTLSRKRHNKNMGKPGHPTLLSTAEEQNIVVAILTASDWGYPFEPEDVKLIVKSYLDRSGKQIRQFQNNKPGDDWVSLFMKRHKNEIKKRLCENIKRARAAVTRETIEVFFDNIQKELDSVPPSNLINYDETCFIDDPGKTKVLIRRSSKHPDRIIDSSKTATSVMFAVAADGVMLPPYVVYKAENVWSTWIEGGPDGCIYNRTGSGWFDQGTFEDWFLKVIVPYFRRKDGNKAIIGDNLASHLSLKVIETCQEMGIKNIFLPPNSTHILQPLDVCVFRPMKGAWRKVLKRWRNRNKGPIRKDFFPRVLKATLDKLSATNSDNIKSGFSTCGIHPVNRDRILTKFPAENQSENNTATEMANTVATYLKTARFGNPDKPKLGKKKKLDIAPGQSVTAEMIASTSRIISNGSQSAEDDNQEDNIISRENSPRSEETEDLMTDRNDKTANISEIKENDFIMVKFLTVRNNEQYFIGKVTKIETGNVVCSFTQIGKIRFIHFPKY